MKNKQKLIYSTKDYSKFVQDPTNRTAGRHPKLKSSMEEYGWLPEHPAVVVPDGGGKFRIKDGGHRITIAKELGLPVYYVLSENDNISIPMINEAQRSWTLDDYVSAFVKQGNKHYERLVQFSAETGIKPGISATLLGNGSGASLKVKSGDFKVSTEEHARKVLMVVDTAAKAVSWARQSKFISAVSMILRYSSASPKVMCDKLRSHPSMLIPQADAQGVISMLENIYNYRNREQVAIALAVKQGVRAAQQENCKRMVSNRTK